MECTCACTPRSIAHLRSCTQQALHTFTMQCFLLHASHSMNRMLNPRTRYCTTCCSLCQCSGTSNQPPTMSSTHASVMSHRAPSRCLPAHDLGTTTLVAGRTCTPYRHVLHALLASALVRRDAWPAACRRGPLPAEGGHGRRSRLLACMCAAAPAHAGHTRPA